MNLSRKALGISPSITLKVSAMAKKMRQEGRDVVGFGAGEPDFDTPQYIKDAAKKALDLGLTKYTPASGMPELKAAITKRLGDKYGLVYSPGDIVISNGAKHSLFNVFAAILNPGDEVIIPVPYWLTYPELVRMSDGVPVFLETDATFKATAKSIRAAVTDKTKALLLNSPSNPCGAIYTKQELKEIANVCLEAGIFVVSDEIYDELVYEGEHVSIASLGADIKDLTILVNGMSKTYAMTGWRIGYTASTGELASVMGAYQSHAASNPNSIAQYASIEALGGPQDDVARMKAAFDKRRIMLCKMINDIDGLSCSVPAGAFYVMMNISKIKGKTYDGITIGDSVEFSEMLLKNTLTAVVPGVAFGADDYVRLSYATKEEDMVKGMARIKEFVQALV
ncbi:MAG: pyridoxal phosphate-dependent aminotransferase [Eubacteriales bacterium]|nr:pyridoxal phosphate-dependent aminotransferase [Eubacteriales bacterium]